MKTYFAILKSPLITEKTTALREKSNKVAFKVSLKATKQQIKNAVEKAFGVNVLAIQTLSMHGKVKRLGRYSGQRPNWKKAILTLKEGQSIEYFEGA
jgi:large subunit ribosomal protein L23